MGETIKEIIAKTDKEKVKVLVEKYMSALLDEIPEEEYAKLLLETNKETIAAYIIFGLEELKKQRGKELKLMRKKGMI